MNANTRRWLMKNCAASAAHGQGRIAVGLRQKELPQRFLIATTASRVFQQPIVIISAGAILLVFRSLGEGWLKMIRFCIHPCPSAVKPIP
jgi:hypothetical protein